MLDILKIAAGIVLGLLVREVLRWFKKWLEIRNISPLIADMERRRKEAGLDYDHELLTLVKWSKRKWWLR